MVSAFKGALDSGKFVVTSEVAPPKGTNLDKMAHHIELLKEKVAISQKVRVPTATGEDLLP
jgi:5,10-methylenetetrahydrofolate reductase